MERLRLIQHKGKSILIVDLSNSRDKSESVEVLARAREKIDVQPPKSLLLLTDVSNAHYDHVAAEAVKEYSRANTPFIKASAVIGVSGIKRVIFQAVIKLTGRHIATFDAVEAGLDWLAEQ